MLKKLIPCTIAGLLLVSNLALAATSYTEISADMTGANGASYAMSGGIYNEGHNYSTSKNDLWTELYKSVSGPDVSDFKHRSYAK